MELHREPSSVEEDDLDPLVEKNQPVRVTITLNVLLRKLIIVLILFKLNYIGRNIQTCVLVYFRVFVFFYLS